VAPVLVLSVALSVTRRLSLDGALWDYTGVALSVAAGLGCLWRLPSGVSFLSRAWLAVLYVPAAVGLLMLYSLLFVCVVFGDCL
jgi:hypothetical protein